MSIFPRWSFLPLSGVLCLLGACQQDYKYGGVDSVGGFDPAPNIVVSPTALLYETIDNSSLYLNRVAPDCRSRMNIPFFLRDEQLNAGFLAGAQARGLLQLKGHKSVGGMRASLYNAMPLAGVQALVDYMREFEKNPR